MKRKFCLLLAGLLLTGVMTSCGTPAETTGSVSDTDTQVADTDSVAADGPETAPDMPDTGDNVQPDNGEKVWVIATDTSFKPFEYVNASGELMGIDIDILSAIAEDQGFKYTIQVLGWDSSLEACQTGLADGMMASVSITEDRKAAGWIFSDGYFESNQVMAVADNSDITGFEDLAGREVAVKTETVSAEYARSLSDKYGFSVAYFEESPQVYQAVADGKAAACFDDAPILASKIRDADITLKILEDTGNEPTQCGFVTFNESNREFIDMFNKGLSNIRADGRYDAIIAKYLGE